MNYGAVESTAYIMRYKIIEFLENSGCIINRIIGVKVNLNTMRAYGTAVCVNDYGSIYHVARVEIISSPEEKLSLYRDGCKSKYGCISLEATQPYYGAKCYR